MKIEKRRFGRIQFKKGFTQVMGFAGRNFPGWNPVVSFSFQK
jgi:hypothetical protein